MVANVDVQKILDLDFGLSFHAGHTGLRVQDVQGLLFTVYRV